MKDCTCSACSKKEKAKAKYIAAVVISGILLKHGLVDEGTPQYVPSGLLTSIIDRLESARDIYQDMEYTHPVETLALSKNFAEFVMNMMLNDVDPFATDHKDVKHVEQRPGNIVSTLLRNLGFKEGGDVHGR